jgi:hypothetical protein
MLDNSAYKHTLGICNIYCSSTATVVVGTRLEVALYVHYSVTYVTGTWVSTTPFIRMFLFRNYSTDFQ